MRKEVKFENDSELKDFQEYDENKLAIAKICVLSTAPNSHQLNISEEVLRRDIGTIRGNFLVADIMFGDATTHTPNEVPVGYFLPNEDIEFEEVEKDGMKIVKAWAYAVLSKRYANAAYNLFVQDNHRATSIEMTVETPEDDEHEVLSFNAFGSTILGKTVAPSCKDAEISLVRFAEEANTFFDKKRESINSLKQFVEERKKKMVEQEKYVSHPIDTSKEAVYEGEWNGQKAKQDLVKEKNFKTLAPEVCMKLESGWEDREVIKLGYPVMMLHDGKWVYSTKGLSSALGYARKENETAVVNKVEKIYKNLGLDQDGKEKGTKMAEKNANFEIEGRKAWGEVIKKVQDHEGKGAYVDSIEDNHIIYTKDNVRYRVEADIKVDKDDKSVDADIKWGTVKKDADQKMSNDYNCNDEHNHSDDGENGLVMSVDEMKAKMAKMKSEIENRDNIIMEKDKKMGEMEKELSELREFKKTCMEKEKATSVDAIMNEVKEYMEDEQFKNLRDEGLACEFSQIDAWSNKVKAFCFEKGRKNTKTNSTIMTFSANFDYSNKKKPKSVWETL